VLRVLISLAGIAAMQYAFLIMAKFRRPARAHSNAQRQRDRDSSRCFAPILVDARDNASGGEVVWKKGRLADEDD
jgi:hypothetical protein